MALAKYKCTRCEETFTAGDWNCKSGDAHEVAEKLYYVMDAPSIQTTESATREAFRASRLLMCNVVPELKRTNGTDVVTIPGKHVEFIRGKYSTIDPQIQNSLDQRAGVYQGEDGLKLWENAYLTPEQKHGREKDRLVADNKRLENERNTLLEQVKEKAKPAGKAV